MNGVYICWIFPAKLIQGRCAGVQGYNYNIMRRGKRALYRIAYLGAVVAAKKHPY
jgi:hypothetical protein